MQPASVTVALVTHQSARDLAACLDSLGPALVGPGTVVVVDNASTDGSAELARAHPIVDRVIVNDRNIGYAAALEQARAATAGEWFVMANPDVVFGAGALAALVEFLAAHPRHAIAGPRLVDAAGREAPSARGFPTLALEAAQALRLRRLWPDNPIHRGHWRPDLAGGGDADWVTGAVLVARRAALEAVGGIDPGYFLYFEEIDLAWRLAHAGWKVAYRPEATAVHAGGGSSRGREAALAGVYRASQRRFFARAYGKAAVPALCVLQLAGTALDGLARALKGGGPSGAT